MSTSTHSRLSGRFGAATASVFLVATLAVLSGCGGSDRDDAPAPRPADKSAKGSTASAAASVKANAPGAVRKLKDTSFEHSWDLQLPKRIRNAWISPELPDIIFFQIVDTYEIYAVDAYSGNTRWVTPAFDKPARLLPGASRSTAINRQGESVTDDRIWVIADDTLFSFDAVYGQVVWRWQLPFSPSTSPMAVGADATQRVFIGDWEGRLRVVTNHPDKGFPYVLWQWNLLQPLSAEPVNHEGLVYVGDHSGKVHCFKLDRDLVWSFDTGAAVYGSVLTRGRTLYVGNDNNTLYALNRLSGERIGALYMNGAIKRAPFAFDGEPGRIYVWVEASNEKAAGLYAIKTQSDTVPFTEPTRHPLEVERLGVEWFAPQFDRLVGSTPEHLFVTKGDSTVIHALHRATGKVMWSWDTNELHQAYVDERGRKDPRDAVFVAQYHDRRDQNRSLYTADDTGHIIAFRVFGDKPGDPLTGASAVKRAAAKSAEKPAAAGDAAKPEKAPEN
ncbi:MAG: PQQ-binding-like beta-propeller repeat protein [Planctomycetes bacterium]|nr:PQQ-binding-like beta-propeller repeat protein [Planctomycetota bacterium]